MKTIYSHKTFLFLDFVSFIVDFDHNKRKLFEWNFNFIETLFSFVYSLKIIFNRYTLRQQHTWVHFFQNRFLFNFIVMFTVCATLLRLRLAIAIIVSIWLKCRHKMPTLELVMRSYNMHIYPYVVVRSVYGMISVSIITSQK